MDTVEREETKGSQRRRLRRFGLTIGCAFVILALLLLWRGKVSWPIFAAAGGLSLILAAFLPGLLGPVERVWMKGALLLGWVMTRLILGVIFITLFTPAGLILRLLGKDPLELRFRKEAVSYWRPREDQDPSPERMERMF
jgi:hypothetical protein